MISRNEGIYMINNSIWIVLNSLVYKIYSIDNLYEMRNIFLVQLKEIIDFDSGTFILSSSSDTHKLVDYVTYNYPETEIEFYINNQKDLDYSEGIMFSGKSMVYRASDLISEKVRVATEYYKQIYAKNNWHYSLHLNIIYKDIFLGTISLFRQKGKDDFTYENTFVLDVLKDHLALCLYKKRNKAVHFSSQDIRDCGQKYGLSRREICVLKRLVTEKTVQDISEELVITTNTLRKHISSIYKKMGISSRIQLFDKINN